MADPSIPATAEIAARVLGAVQHFNRELTGIIGRLRATRESLVAAQQAAAPHPVSIGQVAVHAPCRGLGCISCGNTGVSQRNGVPFQATAASSPAARAIASHVPSLTEIETAKRGLRLMADTFLRTADHLKNARDTALELAALFDALSR
jgi:hypothetical protein